MNVDLRKQGPGVPRATNATITTVESHEREVRRTAPVKLNVLYHDFNDVVLLMKCLDPDVNPPPPTSQYDFTISRDLLTDGAGHV